jgi:hypothetical protein
MGGKHAPIRFPIFLLVSSLIGAVAFGSALAAFH